MNKEIQYLIITLIMVLLLSYLITSGIWWVVLWSFGFPMAFMWKQTIGVWIAIAIFAPKHKITLKGLNGKGNKKSKGSKEWNI